ncbi:hypothetical protein U9M48_042994, partial [Paspalum notatum var. saurae]
GVGSDSDNADPDSSAADTTFAGAADAAGTVAAAERNSFFFIFIMPAAHGGFESFTELNPV